MFIGIGQVGIVSLDVPYWRNIHVVQRCLGSFSGSWAPMRRQFPIAQQHTPTTAKTTNYKNCHWEEKLSRRPRPIEQQAESKKKWRWTIESLFLNHYIHVCTYVSRTYVCTYVCTYVLYIHTYIIIYIYIICIIKKDQ